MRGSQGTVHSLLEKMWTQVLSYLTTVLHNYHCGDDRVSLERFKEAWRMQAGAVPAKSRYKLRLELER